MILLKMEAVVKKSRNSEEEEEEEEELCDVEDSDPQELHPPSYRINSSREIRLLAIAENFQRQYSLLHPDRKPLLLCPLNECGVRKFVSTTLRPTTTSHCDLLTWQGCASFVSDFLLLEPLDPPTELPSQMLSSTSVLLSQKGNSFEFSSLLCSLLLGINYDSYCVSGYAVRETCLQDQSLQLCPLLDSEDERVQSEVPDQEKQTEKKYTVKRPRELRSRFLIQQEKKKKQEAEAALAHKKKLQEESEFQPPDDFLRGLRVHCWVLVLSGSRGVKENFFIDPLTGNSYPTDSADFLGIEGVWNHLNYFVNMQDCSAGCAGVVFDLEDSKLWEPVLFGATSRKKLMLHVLDQNHEKPPRVFEMPRSWVSYISISEKDLEMLYPGGRKVTRYRKAKLEKFSPCLNADGLVTRLTTYRDLHCSEVATVKEWYKYRNDSLEEKEINQLENITSERFSPGRLFHLLSHRWKSLRSGTERQMEFGRGRKDGLLRTVLSPREMLAFFEGREDFLYYQHVYFDQVDPSERNHCKPGLENLHILKVLERFHRNPSKPANKDVAERLFLVPQGQMELTYHLMEHRFIPSKTFLMKPQTGLNFTTDMVSIFQVDQTEKPPQFLSLLRMLHAMMIEEDKLAVNIEESIKEIATVVAHREQEDQQVDLWTPSRSAPLTRSKNNKQAMAAEERRWLKEQNDILARFLNNKNPKSLSPEEANRIYKSCLSEFRDRMMEHSNLLQTRLKQESEALQSLQTWHEQHKGDFSEKEIQHLLFKKTLQVSTRQEQLDRHKKLFQKKCDALEQKLRRDPRLAPHLNT
ncbi:dynein regulatory complex subunit 7 isoform X1 [Kryptolebias marmoratus]|uniref:dynein regulatory complex subunit 7 isoform X1 n=2 Tax=Kryptolebias marmoratus TaxID=37003 RepID=UPI0007F923DA|nr:dynein regulatory complex subunit 7 isoform X1 [Kryptolebias marmoratus]